MAELEYKSIPARFEVKDTAEGEMLHIKAYGCAFGNIDKVRDVIPVTACDAFLASEDKARMQLCYQHNYEQIIGKYDYESIAADSNGLCFEADLLPTSWGKDAEVLIKAGLLDSFSIGYWADEYHYEAGADGQGDVRVLDAITIKEISLVTNPCNPKAKLISAKDEEGAAARVDVKTLSDTELDALRAECENEQFNRYINNL